MFRELIRSGIAGLERGEDRAGMKLKPRQGPDLGKIQDSEGKSSFSSREKGWPSKGLGSSDTIILLCLKQSLAEEWNQYKREQKRIPGILIHGLGITQDIDGAVCGRRSGKKINL